jgi:hypothetical protein
MNLLERLIAARTHFAPALTDEELDIAKEIAAANDGLEEPEISKLINDKLGLQERYDKWKNLDADVDEFNRDLADLVAKWNVCSMVPPAVVASYVTQCLIGAGMLFTSLEEQAMARQATEEPAAD